MEKTQLKQLAEMDDESLKSVLFKIKKELGEPFQCFWSAEKHKSSTHNKFYNFIRHITNCKHRQDHSLFINSSDAPMKYPIYDEEDMTNYRSVLGKMNGCYEYMEERLGDKRWGRYENKIEFLLKKFYGKFCNMGKVGYQQSVMFSNGKWKVKKNKQSPSILLDSRQMFNFFIDEFKPLLEDGMNNYVICPSSFEFWHFKLIGERTGGQKRRMALEQEIIDNPEKYKTKIVGEHIIGDRGQIIFTKNGKPIYAN